MEPHLSRPDGDTDGAAYRGVSYWLDALDEDLAPRPPLRRDLDVDVAVVGGGYTGLWTAYYLAAAQPGLRVAVLEAEIAGYGASGRNGGWCSDRFAQSVPALARRHGPDAARAMHRAMVDTVAEVGRVVVAEGIDCGFTRGGTVVLARNPAQLARAQTSVATARELGIGDPELLSADAARARCGATRVLGGTYTPHCAAFDPARLVRGLARVVERQGVAIFERTPARSLRPGSVVTEAAVVRAPVVVRATEGFTAGLPGHRRDLAPLYSLMVVTPPLPDGFFDEVGLAGRETFADYRHLVIYGQRTDDDRLAFGGRGAPYHAGSRVRPDFDRDPRVFTRLRRTLADLFPALGTEPEVTHAWGGPLGVSRDWHPSVGLQGAGTGPAHGWAGGYVGQGVGTANLAGRTLAELITGGDGELTRLPWVGHRWRRWEPEPLRWLGVNAGLRAMTYADAAEVRSGRPSRLAATLGRLTGY